MCERVCEVARMTADNVAEIEWKGSNGRKYKRGGVGK